MKRIGLLVVVLVLVVAVSNVAFAKGKGWRTDESEKYLKWWDKTYKGTDNAILGGILYQKGDYEGAIAGLEESVQSGTEDGRVYYQLAFSYEQKGKIDKAIEFYKKSAALLDEQDPKHRYHYYARYNLALLYKDIGDLDNAVKAVEKALEKHKEPSGHNLLGFLYWTQGKKDEALKEYQISVKIDPNQEDAQYNLGVLYYNKGDLENAKEAFEKVKELNPDHPKALVYLGNLGDETILSKAEYTDLLIPDPALRHCYLGKKYLDKGNIADARLEYETGFEVNPDSPIVNQGLAVAYEYNSEGVRYGKGFNIEKSIFHYEKALSADPNLVEAGFNLAVLYSMEGKIDDSIRLYLRTIRLDPSYAKAHYNLAVIYDNETKNYKRARYHYTRYLQLEPETPKKAEIETRLRRLIK